MLAERRVGLVADNDLDLALVDNGVELGLDLGIQQFADVLELEGSLVVSLADTDTDHVALAGVHQTLDDDLVILDLGSFLGGNQLEAVLPLSLIHIYMCIRDRCSPCCRSLSTA